MDQQKLLDYCKKKKMAPKYIDERGEEREEFNQTYSNRVKFRYNHEKNKILFLIYTIKLIQKYIK